MAREEYQAELTITSNHTYRVEARSPEEAISNAEDLYRAGDRGEVSDYETEYADAFPIRDELIEDTEEADEYDTSND